MSQNKSTTSDRDAFSLYRGVCSLTPGQTCWYSSKSHEWTEKPVIVGGPVSVHEDKTLVPIQGPQQSEPGYEFKADHTEQIAYQRYGSEAWNELTALRIEF